MNKRTLFTGLAGIAIVLSACNATPSASGGTAGGAKGPTAPSSSAPTSRSRSSPTARRSTASGASSATASRPGPPTWASPSTTTHRPRERHAGHVAAHRRGRRQEAERPRRLDPEPGRPQPVDQEGHRRRHPGRLDELRARTCSRASASWPTSGRPSSRPASAPASGSRPPASRTPSASTRKSATRR